MNKLCPSSMGGVEHAYWFPVYFTRNTPSWLNVDLIERIK